MRREALPRRTDCKINKEVFQLPNCSNGLCPFDLVREWEDNKCPIELSNSLVYDVHIANNPDGSLKDFTCEFGPMYKLVDSTPTEATIKDCSQETVESLDNAIKGKT